MGAVKFKILPAGERAVLRHRGHADDEAFAGRIGNNKAAECRERLQPRHHDLAQLFQRLRAGPIDVKALHQTEDRDIGRPHGVLGMLPQ